MITVIVIVGTCLIAVLHQNMLAEQDRSRRFNSDYDARTSLARQDRPRTLGSRLGIKF